MSYDLYVKTADYYEKYDLPKEFLQVEYIENDQVAYIDIEFKPNQNSKMILDFQPLEKQSTCYAGCRYGQTTGAFTINSGNAARTQLAAMNKTGNVTLGSHNTNRHLISIEKEKFVYDGVEAIPNATKIGEFQCTYSIYLFACNTDGPTLNALCKIYSCKIYDNGILIRHLIPCINKNNNQAGFFDIVNSKFYTNTVGTLTPGSTYTSRFSLYTNGNQQIIK